MPSLKASNGRRSAIPRLWRNESPGRSVCSGPRGAASPRARVVLLARAGRKPGSVPTLPPVVVIPLGRPLPDGSCDQLEIESTRATPAGCPAISDRSCSRWGLPCPPRHRGRGALLPHRFTLTDPCGPAVYFLLHCPSSHPDWPLASTLPCGARTFLDAALRPRRDPPHQLQREASASIAGAPSGRQRRVRRWHDATKSAARAYPRPGPSSDPPSR